MTDSWLRHVRSTEVEVKELITTVGMRHRKANARNEREANLREMRISRTKSERKQGELGQAVSELNASKLLYVSITVY